MLKPPAMRWVLVLFFAFHSFSVALADASNHIQILNNNTLDVVLADDLVQGCVDLEIFNMIGNSMGQYAFRHQQNFQIKIDFLVPGIYFLRIQGENEGNRFALKFIKQY